MDRFWIKQYPPGTPTDIDPDEYASLKALIEQGCTEFAGRSAYLQMGHTMGYAELDRLSRRFAAWLQSQGMARAIGYPSCCPTCCSTRSSCSAHCAPGWWSSTPIRSTPRMNCATS